MSIRSCKRLEVRENTFASSLQYIRTWHMFIVPARSIKHLSFRMEKRNNTQKHVVVKLKDSSSLRSE